MLSNSEKSRNDSLYSLLKNLESAENVCRNRRYFEEADAVKFARQVLMEETIRIIDEQKKMNPNNANS